MNKLVSILTGCAAGIAVIFVMDMLGHQMFPPPPELSLQNPEDLKKFIALMPVGAFLLLLGGAFLGSFVGGIVSAWIARENKFMNVIIVGVVLTALGVLNFMMIPHPMWFMIASLVIYFAGALGGYKLTMMIKKNA
jgi:hypothetical protein